MHISFASDALPVACIKGGFITHYGGVLLVLLSIWSSEKEKRNLGFKCLNGLLRAMVVLRFHGTYIKITIHFLFVDSISECTLKIAEGTVSKEGAGCKSLTFTPSSLRLAESLMHISFASDALASGLYKRWLHYTLRRRFAGAAIHLANCSFFEWVNSDHHPFQQRHCMRLFE
ncbi:hypothetical protein CEXT_320661 [Caerostris extrusa]|uniref:Uncharacterized protein n=1 Tax=Caerostris extrusa TaxID=172846 RepID=A0AAV4P9S0_CAEEX|nr:hypothetical protein CEXT_320661 [Caerostris extrusa]